MAVALNPVDLKVRSGAKAGLRKGDRFPTPKIVGFDGAGVVHAAHPGSAFQPGDEVWWAGDLTRAGTLQQFQLVDARLVSRKPRSLTFPQAASLPLCAITAYEAMKERMRVQPGKSILITAGAGGVGSIATQLAHHWGLRVIASVSRPETAAWTKAHGAQVTVDHRRGIERCFGEQGLGQVDYVLNTFSERLLTDVMPVVAPFGHVAGINSDLSAEQVPALQAMQTKTVSYHLSTLPHTPHTTTPAAIPLTPPQPSHPHSPLPPSPPLMPVVCQGVHVRQADAPRPRAECRRPAGRGGGSGG